MNIYDIAKKCDVSIATVSRVINNQPGVQRKVREQIEKYIEESGYVPNLHARELNIKKTNVIGIVMPGINDYFTRRIEAVNRICRDKGYSLMITANSTGVYNEDEEISNLLLLSKKQVDGILFFSVLLSDSHIKMIEKINKSIPVVIIDNEIPLSNISSVVQDHYKGAAKLIYHLIEKDYKKIGFISGPQYDQTSIKRERAWRDILTKSGMQDSLKYYANGDFRIDSGYKAMSQLLSNGEDKPEVVFTANDYMAIGAMKAIKEKNLKIPEDIGLAGFDDVELVSYLSPSLTTVKQDQAAIGEKSAVLLTDLIEGKNEAVNKIELEQELIIRNSTR